MLADLNKEGYSLRDIEHFTRITKGGLAHYKIGGEPSHSNGEKLLAFWAQTMSLTVDDAPMISKLDYRA